MDAILGLLGTAAIVATFYAVIWWAHDKLHGIGSSDSSGPGGWDARDPGPPS